MKAFALFILTLLTVAAYSQNSINNYKYVLVPDKFDFLKTENQYGLNTLTKSLLNEIGFTAFIGSAAMPPQVAANKCSALRAEVVENNSMFVTKLTLLLKDCQNNIIFKSKEGKSREKEWPIAYNEALNDAFTSLKAVYKYDSSLTQAPQAVVTTPVPAAPPAPVITTPTPAIVTEASDVLYAQPTANGYQLIDTTPKKVVTLFNTSLQDHFIAQNETSNGIVFKKNGEWFFEYYKDNKLMSQKLQIKF